MKKVKKNNVNILRIAFLCMGILICTNIYSFADSDINDISISEGNNSTTQTEVNVEVLRISSSDTSGLHSIVLDLIGDYNSIVKDYTYITTSYNGSQQTNHVVEITPDYSWIGTCLLFIVMIYCLFRFLSALVSGGKI